MVLKVSCIMFVKACDVLTLMTMSNRQEPIVTGFVDTNNKNAEYTVVIKLSTIK